MPNNRELYCKSIDKRLSQLRLVNDWLNLGAKYFLRPSPILLD